MNKIISLLITLLSFIFISCAENDDIDTVVSTTDNFEEVVNLLDTNIEQGKFHDVASLIDGISNIDGFESYEQVDNAIYLKFKDGNEYYVNFSGSSSYSIGQTRDQTAFLESYIDNFEKSLGYNSGDNIQSKIADTSDKQYLSESYTDSRGAESATRPVILKTRNILFWSPLLSSGDSDYKNFISVVKRLEKRLNVQIKITSVLRDNQSSMTEILKKMNDFNQYNFVYIACHGGEKGELMIPRDESISDKEDKEFTKGYAKNFTTGKMEKCYLVPRKYIDQQLPSNLNRTIIWCCMCYAAIWNSHTMAAFKTKNVADFWGPTNSITGDFALSQFCIFYAGFQAGEPSRKVARVSIPYSFRDEDGLEVSGQWENLESGTSMCYVRTKPVADTRHVRGKIIFPTQIVSLASTRALDNDGRFFGIQLTNNKGKSTLYYISDLSQYATFQNTSSNTDVVCLDYALSTDWLEEGEYELRTFADTEDGRLFSDESCVLYIKNNYTEKYSGKIPHYHYYKYLLNDGTYNTIYEGTQDCTAWAEIKWINRMPSVYIHVYTTALYNLDTAGKNISATSVGYPLSIDSYSFQYAGNKISINAEMSENSTSDTQNIDTHISFAAQFDLNKGTLYIDHLETWSGYNEYGNVRALYHPQGTILRE